VTNGASIGHHRSTDYRIHDSGPQPAGFTITVSEDGRTVHVEGACPSCGGRFTTTWSFGTGNGYKAYGGRRHRPPVPSGFRTVCCDCGHAHARRPADAVFLGCGAYWQVDLP
jgi:hypothetical protein